MSTFYNKGALPEWRTEKETLRRFLLEFVGSDVDDSSNNKYPYLQQLQAIANHTANTLTIQLDHIAHSSLVDPNTLSRIQHNTLRYRSLLYHAADRILRTLKPTITPERSAHDIWLMHRETKLSEARAKERQLAAAGSGAPQPRAGDEDELDYDSDEERERRIFPVELLRRYEIHILPLSFTQPLPMRAVKGDCVGSLVSVCGIVTRVTDVSPLVKVVTYICTTCGWETYQQVDDRQFTPLKQCPSTSCASLNYQGHLTQQTRGSKFVRYQSVKLQERPAEVPVGHIPRSINMRLYGELCRTVKPGDEVTVSGIFLPTPYVGYRAIRAGLAADVYIEVTHLIPAKQQYSDIDLSQSMVVEIERRAAERDIYHQLAASIAPEIYGHEDVKKALLLLLISGVTRTMEDGVKIRGDINVLLMGDPGVAKSQLLKHIAHIAPRGVYTTGKGSSGVGLTAAVVRDGVSGDMSLEGGSLVLADKGVCCIDEFDKMEEGDRTAIHEVMEQQTVSIAKAGITTTLNARTAVLAAANPVYGRWDKRKSHEANLGLPTSLLSRFDLSFIILDRAVEANDLKLAQHVTHVHMHSEHPKPEGGAEALSPALLRAYIAHARSFEPYVPKYLMHEIVQHYITLRREDDDSGVSGGSSATANQRQRFVTPRSLLSILRLAQAHARCHLRAEVNKEDIAEAVRLLNQSKESSEQDDSPSSSAANNRQEPISAIYDIVRGYRSSVGRNRVGKGEVERLVLSRGYRAEQFVQCLDLYERLNVWIVQSKDIVFMHNTEQFGAEDEEEEEDEEMEY